MSRGNVYQTLQKLRTMLDEERGPSSEQELIGGARRRGAGTRSVAGRRKVRGRGLVAAPASLGYGCMYGNGAYIGGAPPRRSRARRTNPWSEFIALKHYEHPGMTLPEVAHMYKDSIEYANFKAAAGLPPPYYPEPVAAGRRRRY